MGIQTALRRPQEVATREMCGRSNAPHSGPILYSDARQLVNEHLDFINFYAQT